MSNIVVVAPHPDDETLGCGGTLLKLKDRGNKIFWVIMTNVIDHPNYSKNFIQKRQDEIDMVSEKYGFDKVFKLNYLTTKLDTIPISEITIKISNVFNEIKPEVIFIPSYSDIHSDHRITFQIVMSCTKSFRYPFIKKILMYEKLSETEFAPPLSGNIFSPNVFYDISNYLDKKIEIMKIYTSELRESPFPRSIKLIKTLAILRGSTCNSKYAEAFQLIKEIV